MLLPVMPTSLLLVQMLSIRVAELLHTRVSLQIVGVNEQLCAQSKKPSTLRLLMPIELERMGCWNLSYHLNFRPFCSCQ